MGRFTKCDECPMSGWKGQREVQIYRPVYAQTVYKEIGFRGNKKADVLIVGESPGSFELLKGSPFVGSSGAEVRRAFAEIGMDPFNKFVYITNACRCMIIKDEMSDKQISEAMAACRPQLEAAIRYVKPKIIVAFGNVALKQLTKLSGITKKRGTPVWSEEFACWVYPTFHPAYCLRNRDMFTFWNPDMYKLGQIIDNDYTPISSTGESKYVEVQSIAFLLKDGEKPKRVGLDTETQGNDNISPNHVVISLAVSPSPTEGYNLVLYEEGDEEDHDFVIQWPRRKLTKKQIDSGESPLVDVFVKKAPNWGRKIRQIVALVKDKDIAKYVMTDYDNHQLEWLGNQIGVDLSPSKVKRFVMDIQTGAHCLSPDAMRMGSLDNIHRVFCPERPDHKGSGLVDVTDMLKSLRVDRTNFTLYAAKDPADTLACGMRLRKILAEDKRLIRYYKHFVMPVTMEVLYRIKKTGIGFDTEAIGEAKERVAALVIRAHTDAVACIPKAVKRRHEGRLTLTRSDLLIDTLFSKDGFNLPVLERSKKTKAPQTTKSVFKRLKDELDPESTPYRFLTLLETWKPYSRLYGTNLKGFEEAVRADGRLHTSTSTTGTGTGRTNSWNPNLQNIPKRFVEAATIIRRLLVARPGYVLLAVDYSQAELRWIAVRAREAAMRKIYKNGEDIHTNTAQAIARMSGMVWGKLKKAVIDDMRRKAKSVNFGFVYGMHPKRFRNYAYDEYGLQITLAEAGAFQHVLLEELYPGLPAWHEREIQFGRKYGYARSPLGRVRLLPNIHSDDFQVKSEDERRAINMPIQSAASDCALLGAKMAIRKGIIDDKNVFLTLFVHDELVFEVRESVLDKYAPQLLDCMEELPLEEFGASFPIPMVTEAKVGYNLAELESYTR